jgi:hypothetical protein
MAYDNLNKVWKKSGADLTDIDHTMGLWVYMSQVSHLKTVGVVPESTNINLYAGWNLVGYPSFTAKTVSNALSSISYDTVFTYDSSDTNDPWKYTTSYKASYFHDLSNMGIGSGYWVEISSGQSWLVAGE